MKLRLLLLLIIILAVCNSCTSPNRYQSDRRFSNSEYDPGVDYSPGSNGLTEFDDDSSYDSNDEEYRGNYSEINRELTPIVKERVDKLLIGYFGNDEVIKKDSEQRLIEMGETIVGYIESKMSSTNQLELLSLVNKIKNVDAPDIDNESRVENENNSSPDTNIPDDNEYQPDEALNNDTLEELGDLAIDQNEIQKFYKLNLQKLQKAYESNDFKKAKDIAQALLTLFPKQENTVQYLKYLIEKIDDALQSNGILQGKVSTDKDSYEYNEKISFRFLLRNVSSKPVKIVFSNDIPRARTEYATYYSPCIIHLTLSQWSEKTSASHKESIPYKLEGSAELNPGEVWQHVWEYDTKRTNEGDSIGSVKISADIRPLQVFVNEERVSIKTIKLIAREVKVYPKGYKDLTQGDNVIKNLKDALKNEEAVRIVISATAAGRDEDTKWEATEILINALKTARGEFRIGIFRALRAIHGFDLAYDENFWRDWYENKKPK